MVSVPLPDGLERVENLPRTRRSLQNCFNNLKGQIISRPGISLQLSTANVARGSFVWNGALYFVVGENLIRILDTESFTFSVVGPITMNGRSWLYRHSM